MLTLLEGKRGRRVFDQQLGEESLSSLPPVGFPPSLTPKTG